MVMTLTFSTYTFISVKITVQNIFKRVTKNKSPHGKYKSAARSKSLLTYRHGIDLARILLIKGNPTFLQPE